MSSEQLTAFVAPMIVSNLCWVLITGLLIATIWHRR